MNIKKDDSRNWNGGICFEDDPNLIKTVYETIRRLESMLDRGDIKVLYSIRSMNEIGLRITTPIEQSKLPIDVESLVNFIENRIERLDNLPYSEYKIERTWSSGNKRDIEIVPYETKFHTDVSNFDERLPGDRILKRIIENKWKNNSLDLAITANFIIKSLKDFLGGDIVAEYYEQNENCNFAGIIYIKHNNTNLIKITSSLDVIAIGKIKTSVSFFRQKFADVEINKLKMEIVILVEKGYGDPD